MAKFKNVLSRKYIYGVLADVASETSNLDATFRAATASDTFGPALKATVDALNFVATSRNTGGKLGNKGREKLIVYVDTAHAAFKKTQGAALRSDTHNVIEHSLFRLAQRLREDNAKTAVRK